MSGMKGLYAGFGCREGKAVALGRKEGVGERSLKSLVHEYNDNGADGLLFWDLSEDDQAGRYSRDYRRTGAPAGGCKKIFICRRQSGIFGRVGCGQY